MLLPADHLVQTAFAVPVGQPVKKHFRIFGRAFLQVVCHLPGGGGNLPQRGGCGLQPIAQDQWRDLLFPPGGNELARPARHRRRQQPKDSRRQQDLQKAGDTAGSQHCKKAVADGKREYAAQPSQRRKQPAQQPADRKAGDGKGKFPGGEAHYQPADHPDECPGTTACTRRRNKQQHGGRHPPQRYPGSTDTAQAHQAQRRRYRQ